jgi:anti-anti-sigma factor
MSDRYGGGTGRMLVPPVSWPRMALVQSSFQVALDHRGYGVTVVSVAGEVDLLTCPTLQAKLDRALSEEDCRQLVIDLSRVEFLAACGVRCVEQARQRAAPHVHLRLVVSNAPVRLALDVLDLLEVFDIEQTLTNACQPA